VSDVTHPDAPATDAEPTTRRRSTAIWTALVVVLVVVLTMVVKNLFVQPFYIPSGSMEPGLVKNDRILVEKVSYWGSGTPQRGDVVVFKDPDHWLSPDEDSGPGNPLTKALSFIGLYPSGGHLVKRVIGVGGDRVVCCDSQGRITVNGKALNESSYLPKGTKASLVRFDVRVPSGDLWVMGDNRGESYDSRGHMGDPGGGFVPARLVVGKVVALMWPLSRFRILHRPATFADIPKAD